MAGEALGPRTFDLREAVLEHRDWGELFLLLAKQLRVEADGPRRHHSVAGMHLPVVRGALRQQCSGSSPSCQQDLVGLQHLSRLQRDSRARPIGPEVEVLHDPQDVLDPPVNRLLHDGPESLVSLRKPHSGVEEHLVEPVKVGRGERAVPALPHLVHGQELGVVGDTHVSVSSHALLAKVGRVRPQHADFVVVRAVQAVRSPFRHGLDEHAHVELVWVVVAHNLVDIMRGGSRVGKRGRVHENDPGRFAAPGKRQRGRGAEVARADDEVRGHGGQPALVATGPLGCCDDGLRVSAVGQMCCRFGFPYYLFFHFSEPEVADSECDEENQGRPRQMGAKASRSMRVAGGVSQKGLAAGGVLNGGYGNDDVKVGGKVQVNGDGKGGLGSDKTCIPLLGRA